MKTAHGLYLPSDATRANLQDVSTRTSVLDDQTPGQRFTAKLSSPYFISDPDKWIAELWDPEIYIFDRVLEETTPLESIEGGRSVLVCAREIRGDALYFLVENKLRGIIYAAAIDASSAVLAQLRALGDASRAIVSTGELALVQKH